MGFEEVIEVDLVEEEGVIEVDLVEEETGWGTEVEEEEIEVGLVVIEAALVVEVVTEVAGDLVGVEEVEGVWVEQVLVIVDLGTGSVSTLDLLTLTLPGDRNVTSAKRPNLTILSPHLLMVVVEGDLVAEEVEVTGEEEEP